MPQSWTEKQDRRARKRRDRIIVWGGLAAVAGLSVRHPRTPSVNPPGTRSASVGWHGTKKPGGSWRFGRTQRCGCASFRTWRGPATMARRPSAVSTSPLVCSSTSPVAFRRWTATQSSPPWSSPSAIRLQCPPLGQAEAQGSRGSCHCRALYPAVLTSALRRHGAAVASTVSRAPSRTREPGRTARLRARDPRFSPALLSRLRPPSLFELRTEPYLSLNIVHYGAAGIPPSTASPNQSDRPSSSGAASRQCLLGSEERSRAAAGRAYLPRRVRSRRIVT